ncbi:MAG TPA: right-handed parallel beta-helix repeat-containing protein [Pyrinomonadaceae bacterium]|jgi:hypothetical protein
MNRFRFTLRLLALAVLALSASSVARSQNLRSWISMTGDDFNSCTFTAPCRTFPITLSRTATNGEVSLVGPGTYGAITITKSVTIDGGGYLAAINASGGTRAITINITNVADTRKSVRLRGLSLNGADINGTDGIQGIRIVAADKVYIEDTLIDNFDTSGGTNGRAISDERTNGGKLFVTNTIIRNSGANAVVVFPSAGSTQITAVLDRVVIEGSTLSGVFAGPGSRVTVKDSNITGNGNAGVQADASAGTTEVMVERSVVSHNQIGIYSGPGSPVVRLSETTVTDNVTGLQTAGSGTIDTFGNCRIAGNAAGNGPPTNNLGEQ